MSSAHRNEGSRPTALEDRFAMKKHRTIAGLIAGALTLASSAAAASGWTPPPLDLPVAPPGSTCVLLQRGTAGNVWESDLAPTNGSWAAGAYPQTWSGGTGLHWSAYKFDMSPVPAGEQIVLATFSTYVGWNDQASTVRVHRVLVPWEEATVKWTNFGGAASWDPAVIATFNPIGVGYKTVDVTALVQGWHSGAIPAHGLLLEEDPVKLHGYLASEAGSAAYRPALYVCHMPSDPCASAPCLNGGACAPDGGGYTCTCDDGYSGTICEVAADPCAWGPCQNGGACAALDPLYYACTCVDGYSGFECEVPPDPCDGDPCDGRGICVPDGSSYTCDCLPGWRGNLPSCDTPSCPCTDHDPLALFNLSQPGLEVVPSGLQSFFAACAPGGSVDPTGFRVYITGYDSAALADFQAALAALDSNDPGYCEAAGALWADVILGSAAVTPTPATGFTGAGTFGGTYSGVTFNGTVCMSSGATFVTDADQNAVCLSLIDAAGGGSPVDM